ncbi:MAG TPA: hypothetical protein V6D14_13750 [Coleofasciculaceae cyanobacterium]|jgi:hypothetical protein
MAAPIETTLLALSLALKNLEDPLIPTAQAALKKVGNQLAALKKVGSPLDANPNASKVIEEGLTKVIEGNASLNQLYQAAKAKLDAVDGNIPPELLPSEAELIQELSTASMREIRGRKPGKPAQTNNSVIINDIVIPILKEPSNAQKLSFLERLQRYIQEASN